MKNFKFSRAAFVLGSAFLIGVPTSFLLPGCGGGGGGSSVSVRLFSAPVQLNSAQTATLNLSLRGAAINGTLVVPSATGGGSSAFPPGTYDLTGSFTAPRGFTLQGVAPQPVGTFTISGQIPTSSQTGSFDLTIGDNTISGTIPIINPTSTPVATGSATPVNTSVPTASGTARPTSTPVRTTVPTSRPTSVPTARPTTTPEGLRLTYTQLTGTNAVPTNSLIPIQTGSINVADGNISCTFNQNSSTSFPSRVLTLDLDDPSPLVIGKSYSMVGSGLINTSSNYFETLAGGGLRRWAATSGTLRILSIQANPGFATVVELSFANARFVAGQNPGTTGSFTLSGTAKAQFDN